MNIQAILLAAGRSRRFGSDKLIAELDGEALAVRSARNLLAAGLPVLAVVREPDGAVAARLAGLDGVTVAVCADAGQGMGRSLAYGVACSAQADAWLVALADMPRILPATIAAVADALRDGAALAAPVCAGRRGHPVGFAARWRAPLLALDGDRGARPLIEAHAGMLRPIRTDDPGVLLDLDRPGDLASLGEATGRSREP